MLRFVKLITFDVSGTLIQVKGTVGEQYSKFLLKHMGVLFNESVLQKSFNSSIKHHAKYIPMFGYHHGFTSKQWWQSVFLLTVLEKYPNYGSSKSPVELYAQVTNREIINCVIDKRLLFAFDDVYQNFEWIVLPYAAEVLASLQQQSSSYKDKLVVGVVSNNDSRLISVLNKLKLLQYFDFVFTSYEVGFEKPDKRIFCKALEHASALRKNEIQPNEMLHIGNEIEKDYFAAIDFGCKSILIDPSNNVAVPSTHHISNLSKLKDLFDNGKYFSN